MVRSPGIETLLMGQPSSGMSVSKPKPAKCRVQLRTDIPDKKEAAPSGTASFSMFYKLPADQENRPNVTVRPAITTETMVISLIRMLREGPEVSLNGSPTVSPTTPALWAALPFPP